MKENKKGTIDMSEFAFGEFGDTASTVAAGQTKTAYKESRGEKVDENLGTLGKPIGNTTREIET